MTLSEVQLKILLSLASLFLLLTLKSLGVRLLKQNAGKVYLRNTLNFFVVVAALLIWQEELREFTFSILALVAALAIAMKEFVLCFVGGGYKALNRLFSIGDRIEIGDNLGDVVDSNFLYTKLLEVGPKGLSQQYTGRKIYIPNHVLLMQSIHNLTSSRKYGFHVFKHPVKVTKDILIRKKMMTQVAQSVCAPYLAEARFEMRSDSLKEGLEASKVDPVVSLYFNSTTEAELVVRVPVPVKERGHYQQKIIHRFLEKQGYPRRYTSLNTGVNMSKNYRNL